MFLKDKTHKTKRTLFYGGCKLPKFLTISPTHVPGKKECAWKNFLEGKYISIGWLDDNDLSGLSIAEIIKLIQEQGYKNEKSAINSFSNFLSLNIGDYVAVNNTVDGLFGVGIIKSGYRYEKYKHDTCGDNEYYSHFREVDWIYADYVKRKDIIGSGETGWKPYGTVGGLDNEVPLYIYRLIGKTQQRKG